MIEKMGDKATAKSTMIEAGVPCVPGSEGILEDFEQAKKVAKEIGYPARSGTLVVVDTSGLHARCGGGAGTGSASHLVPDRFPRFPAGLLEHFPQSGAALPFQ